MKRATPTNPIMVSFDQAYGCFHHSQHVTEQPNPACFLEANWRELTTTLTSFLSLGGQTIIALI
jgi:hypothetical protein